MLHWHWNALMSRFFELPSRQPPNCHRWHPHWLAWSRGTRTAPADRCKLSVHDLQATARPCPALPCPAVISRTAQRLGAPRRRQVPYSSGQAHPHHVACAHLHRHTHTSSIQYTPQAASNKHHTRPLRPPLTVSVAASRSPASNTAWGHARCRAQMVLRAFYRLGE